MKRLLGAFAALRHIGIGGGLTGLATGLSWSIIVSLFSLDQLFNGTEFALSLTAPGLMALLGWKALKIYRRILFPIAYLTLLIPLFGIGIGGANILQMSIGGAVGGFCWSLPFMLYYLVRWLIHSETSEFLRNAGTTRFTPPVDPQE